MSPNKRNEVNVKEVNGTLYTIYLFNDAVGKESNIRSYNNSNDDDKTDRPVLETTQDSNSGVMSDLVTMQVECTDDIRVEYDTPYMCDQESIVTDDNLDPINARDSYTKSPVSNVNQRQDAFTCNFCERAFTSAEYCKKHKNRCKYNVHQLGFTDDGTAVSVLNKDSEPEQNKIEKRLHKYNKVREIPNSDKTIGKKGNLKIYKCTYCDKTFTNSGHLTQHIYIHTGKRPFKCTECGKAFSRSSDLTLHFRVHTGERPFKCTLCDKSFTQAMVLTQHIRIHTGEKPFKCTNCVKAFASSSQLRQHMRCHTGERPFQCTECGKTFISSSHLTLHMRLHTGEKPFKCKVCDKFFSRSGNLKQHAKVHTGERPYKCEQCDKAFPTACKLSKHMLTHTGERPYKCTQCEKAFSQSGDLSKHMTVHTGERPYKCTVCVKSFSRSDNLAKHKKLHTSVIT